MAGDASAVLATRNMIVYSAPFATTNDMPDDTVDYGTPWGIPWVDVGYTDGGLGTSFSVDRADIGVDQELDPILQPITGRSITFDTDLAQLTVQNLNRAAGLGSIASVAAGAGTKGHDDLIIGGTVEDVAYSWGFEALQQNGEPFRGVIFRGQSTGSPEPRFGVADDKAVVALEVTALVDTTTATPRVALFRSVQPATS